MMMDDEQRDFLPNLGAGEAIVFCGGWHGSTHAKIRNDHAQTDNLGQLGLEMEARYAQQLWHERRRYYPQFCKFGWLSMDGEDPKIFADFVRKTRQAQKQLLRLISIEAKLNSQKNLAFVRLKEWHDHWKMHPQEQLVMAWMTLLLDANPRPYPEKMDVKPIVHTDLLKQNVEYLMTQLAESEYLDIFLHLKKNTNPRAADALRDHFIDLANFKSF